MDKTFLRDYKGKIIDEMLKVIVDQDEAPENQFEILFRIIQAESIRDEELYGRALDVAQKISDTEMRADALSRLLAEIDFQMHEDTLQESELPDTE
jgi:hypothetical protein